jgi:hypothetical protein
MAPSLRIPISVNTQQFEQQMGELGRITQMAVKQATKELIKLNAELTLKGLQTGLPLLGLFSKELAKAAYQSGLLGKAMLGFTRVALPIAAVVGTFEAIGAITEFARAKIEEFVKTQEKAAAAGVSAEFFQRWVKGGEAIKLSIDDATAALNRFAEAAKSKLGGSDLQKRIVELQEAGNLQGVSTKGFEGAIGNTDKLEATAKIIREMLDKGERLAALDIAEKAFGSKVADNLRADAGYLDRLLESAKAVEAVKLVSQDDINRAVDLTNRLDAAQKLLADRWVPLQRELLKLGLDYNESWVNFYQNVAATVSAATQLLGIFEKLGGKIEELGKASFWTRLTEATGKLGLNTQLPPEMQLTPGTVGGPAQAALASGLKNPAMIAAAQRHATEIQNLLRGDKSKPTGGPKETEEATTALEKQTDQLEKHIKVQEAAADAAGKGVYEQERLRSEALLLAAAERDGETATGEYAESLKRLAERSGEAARRQAEAQDKINRLNQASQVLGSAISTAFTDAVIEGKKLDEVLQSLLKTLAKAAINASIMQLFTPGASGINPFLSFLGLQGKMAGGPVNAGQPYMVGEAGPELMVPGASGMVVPNSALGRGAGGGVTNINYAINATGADSGTVVRIQAVLATHARSIENQARAFASAQSLQATGVMR